MKTDICKCGAESIDHPSLNGCVRFQLDRKATWDNDKARAKMAKLHERRERVETVMARIKKLAGFVS